MQRELARYLTDSEHRVSTEGLILEIFCHIPYCQDIKGNNSIKRVAGYKYLLFRWKQGKVLTNHISRRDRI